MYTIGYTSLCESMPSVAFRTQTIRDAAAAHPEVNLIVADNNLNDQQALANAASFAEKPIDLAIMFHINETIGRISIACSCRAASPSSRWIFRFRWRSSSARTTTSPGAWRGRRWVNGRGRTGAVT